MYSWEIYFSCKSLPEFKLKFNAVLVKIQGEYSLGSDRFLNITIRNLKKIFNYTTPYFTVTLFLCKTVSY